jgi:hypothetical protein
MHEKLYIKPNKAKKCLFLSSKKRQRKFSTINENEKIQKLPKAQEAGCEVGIFIVNFLNGNFSQRITRVKLKLLITLPKKL